MSTELLFVQRFAMRFCVSRLQEVLIHWLARTDINDAVVETVHHAVGGSLLHDEHFFHGSTS